tara:strand:+ start:547 stop:741 length:195 start_codon:yes stop_codon:yes gene_type:complete
MPDTVPDLLTMISKCDHLTIPDGNSNKGKSDVGLTKATLAYDDEDSVGVAVFCKNPLLITQPMT